jgi:hypothetical protein
VARRRGKAMLKKQACWRPPAQAAVALRHETSPPANFLNSTALPSITGLPATRQQRQQQQPHVQVACARVNTPSVEAVCRRPASSTTPSPPAAASPASGPMLPRPSTAVPFVITPMRCPLAVYSYAYLRACACVCVSVSVSVSGRHGIACERGASGCACVCIRAHACACASHACLLAPGARRTAWPRAHFSFCWIDRQGSATPGE